MSRPSTCSRLRRGGLGERRDSRWRGAGWRTGRAPCAAAAGRPRGGSRRAPCPTSARRRRRTRWRRRPRPWPASRRSSGTPCLSMAAPPTRPVSVLNCDLALLVEEGDHALDLRHHLGANAVAGQEQERVCGHRRSPDIGVEICATGIASLGDAPMQGCVAQWLRRRPADPGVPRDASFAAQLFDIPREVCYLNAASWSPLPLATMEAGRAAVARKGAALADRHGVRAAQYERTRKAAARADQCRAPQDVALISSVGYGVATAAKIAGACRQARACWCWRTIIPRRCWNG